MVAIKYTPIVATAFLSLYTGVSASGAPRSFSDTEKRLLTRFRTGI